MSSLILAQWRGWGLFLALFTLEYLGLESSSMDDNKYFLNEWMNIGIKEGNAQHSLQIQNWQGLSILRFSTWVSQPNFYIVCVCVCIKFAQCRSTKPELYKLSEVEFNNLIYMEPQISNFFPFIFVFFIELLSPDPKSAQKFWKLG